MPEGDIQDQLDKYLADAHSVEQQALAQLRAAPGMAGDPELSRIFADHLVETEEQERLVRDRLEARGGTPSRLKEAVMRAGGVAFVLFARSQPDTPGKLTAHAYSYEHLELAGYELLSRVAARAGDRDTAAVAHSIRDQEQSMAQRLEASFGRAVEASLRQLEPDDMGDQLVKYLADAHAIESQSIQLLQRGSKIAGHRELSRLYSDHLEETRRHQELVHQRLQARGSGPSTLKDAAMRLGALNWGAFFQAQPDTPGKLAAFAFALEHLEIGGYEQLRRVAHRAGDQETVGVVDRILSEERGAAGRIAQHWDQAVDASLQAQGVTA